MPQSVNDTQRRATRDAQRRATRDPQRREAYDAQRVIRDTIPPHTKTGEKIGLLARFMLTISGFVA